MSVLKSQRKLSDMEFYHNAVKLRQAIVLFLLRDFGIKPKVRRPENIAKSLKMDAEDLEIFTKLTEKYKIKRIEETFPEWIISYFRETIMKEARQLIYLITKANTIYPTSFAELDQRRELQTSAISCCEQLLQDFQFIITIFDVDINKFLPYVDLIQKEIALLKGWRKGDHRLKEMVVKAEAARLYDREIELEKYLYYDIHSDTVPPRLKEKMERDKRRAEELEKSKKSFSKKDDSSDKPEEKKEEPKKKYQPGEYDKDKAAGYMREYRQQLEDMKQMRDAMNDSNY